MRRLPTLAALLALATAPACLSPPEQDQAGIAIGLFLSFTGHFAAHTINSERALLMAIDEANTAGGVGGHPVRIVARDTTSDPDKALRLTRELLDAGVALVIGPDTSDLVLASRGTLSDRTVLLPSFATSDVLFRVPSWFVMGAPVGRMACELAAQLHADNRKQPLVILNPSGYNSGLAWTLTNTYGFPKLVLPMAEVPTSATIASITSWPGDSFVLAAVPPSAIPLVFDLLAKGALPDPTRWYLSPPLHSPVFLDALPKGALAGASGVSQGTSAEGAAFRARFAARWQDDPLDDAYPFYDAGALAVLSLQRALAREGAVPAGTGLGIHLMAITHAGGTPVRWDQLARGLELLRMGQEIQYLGLSGDLAFDALGMSSGALARWWTIDGASFADRARTGDCH